MEAHFFENPSVMMRECAWEFSSHLLPAMKVLPSNVIVTDFIMMVISPNFVVSMATHQCKAFLVATLAIVLLSFFGSTSAYSQNYQIGRAHV